MTVVEDHAVPPGLGQPLLELLNGFVLELRNAIGEFREKFDPVYEILELPRSLRP